MKNQIIIHASGKQNRIALLENGELAQLFIESEENQRTVGNIYLARVHKVMSGIRAAFIDMGTPKDAFLHFSDAGDHLKDYIQMLNGTDAIPKNARNELKKTNFDKISNYEKQNWAGKILRTDQRLLVQIVKEPIGSKGPRVSTDITIAGRFLVLIPMGEYIAVSRKISNYKERRRLKSVVGSMLPEGFGVIIRTIAQEQDKKALEDDMRNVLKKWERILGRLETAKPPALLYNDLDMTESLVRDLFAKHYDRVLIDDQATF
ncbi:MAG: ribonuclease E/G, partial [Candidatus Halalkalibacterium sp. M3_1C_030]